MFTGTSTILATQANSVHLNYYTAPASAYRISVTPLKDAVPTYFSAATIQDAYFGVQRTGDGTTGMLIFSVWDTSGPATIVEQGDADRCVDFGNEGTGKSCRTDINWTAGETFTFEVNVTPLGSNADLAVHVQRSSTGQRIYLGKLRHTGVIQLTHAYAFVEDYGQVSSNCLTTGERLTKVSALQARVNNIWQIYKDVEFTSYYKRTRCGNIYFGLQDGQFVFGTGGNLVSNPNITRLSIP